MSGAGIPIVERALLPLAEPEILPKLSTLGGAVRDSHAHRVWRENKEILLGAHCVALAGARICCGPD